MILLNQAERWLSFMVVLRSAQGSSEALLFQKKTFLKEFRNLTIQSFKRYLYKTTVSQQYFNMQIYLTNYYLKLTFIENYNNNA